MPYFTSADIDQYYEVHGQGQPVVLVAGYTCDHTFWSDVCRELQPHRQVVVFDNRAVGLSKDGGRPFSIDTLAGDTAALIRHLGLTKPTVVGQSMGGAIVQTMRARFASSCGPSVIVNSTQLFSPKAQLALRSALALRHAGVDIDLIVDTVLPWVAGSAWLATPATSRHSKRR
ncbi:alpha/beta fold hydrolase [Trinickia caryophylli]|uniref:alpha/beta fold hydrolase n=1 Tax=Trinickia caryophylli TaxID=28094 RepID=UPI00363DF826